MFKWLLLFAGIGLFYLWFKGKKQVKNTANKSSNPHSHQAEGMIATESMMQCQFCKVHLPRPNGVTYDDRFYCSKEHLNQLDNRGWLGSAHWHTSPNQDSRPENLAPDLVVIHHISLPPGGFADRSCTQFIVDFFLNKLNPSLHPYFEEIADQKVSSHFLISRDGEIFQFVSTHNKAWHAGLSSFLGREKCNDFSIGIELEGDSTHPFEENQYLALAKLSSQLEAIYPNLQFAGHSDIAPGRKADPGIQFDWKKFQTKNNISVEKLPFGVHSR